jgi:hypothetical protein
VKPSSRGPRWDDALVILVCTSREIHVYDPGQRDAAQYKSLVFENAEITTRRHELPLVLWCAAQEKAESMGLGVFDHRVELRQQLPGRRAS